MPSVARPLGWANDEPASCAVAEVFAAVAGVRGDDLLRQVVSPDLMMAGHGDVQLVVVQQQVPRAVEADLEGGAAVGAVAAVLLAGAGDVVTVCVLQVEGAERVVLAVGDVERVAVEGHALRVAELGLVEGAVLEPSAPVPATAIFLPSRSVMTMRWCVLSAMNRRLALRRRGPCRGSTAGVSSRSLTSWKSIGVFLERLLVLGTL